MRSLMRFVEEKMDITKHSGEMCLLSAGEGKLTGVKVK